MRRHVLLLTLAASIVSVVVAIAVPALPATAVSTRHFALDEMKELSEGEMKGTAVHADGTVTAGVEVRRIDMKDVPLAYSFARGPGGVVYVGTGNEGKIYKLVGDTLTEHADTKQLLVSALAIGPDGKLYAGTLPEGKIFVVEKAGEATEFVRPEKAEHIWALAYDRGTQTLYAGTGPEGKVFAIARDGKASVYYDSEAGHIMSLALDDDGTLYAGTSDESVLLRLRGPGRAEVVYDFPGNELTAIDVHDGIIAAAANEFPDAPRVPSASKSSTKNSKSSKAPSRTPRDGKGKIFRIDRDGAAEELFESTDGHFASIQLAENGVIYAGGAKEGRVYRIEDQRRAATWIDVDERQVLALDLAGKDPFFITGDGGAIYRVVGPRATDGTWTSKVLDAGFISRFGELVWRGEGPIRFQTRSGNTEKPDDTWSGWSELVGRPGPIRSPAARFLQLRARFGADPQAVLRAVTAYYLPRNQRAIVTEVKLKTKEKDSDESDEPTKPSTTYTLTWEVDNPDEDKLRYRLYFRGETQRAFRPMFDDEVTLTKDEYAWNTRGLPDGFYVVEVEASDELENPGVLTRKHRAPSEPIRIDNHAPKVEGLAVRGTTLVGRAVDAVGPIANLVYAVDGQDERVFFPEDDLLDTREERFALSLDHLPRGEHILSVRATDAGGNVGSAEIVVNLR